MWPSTFSKLDNARYAMFKTEFLNGLTFGAIKHPYDLNAIFILANQWLKLKASSLVVASMFSTMLDNTEKPDIKKKGEEKEQGKKKMETNEKERSCFAMENPDT